MLGDESTDRWYAPHRLHDAAMQGYRIAVFCGACGRREVLDGYALWWLFERKRWDDRMRTLHRKMRCKKCGKRRASVAPVYEEATVFMERPTELEWKKSVKRRRT